MLYPAELRDLVRRAGPPPRAARRRTGLARTVYAVACDGSSCRKPPCLARPRRRLAVAKLPFAGHKDA